MKKLTEKDMLFCFGNLNGAKDHLCKLRRKFAANKNENDLVATEIAIRFIDNVRQRLIDLTGF